MINVRENIHDYINTLSDKQINQLYRLILEVVPMVEPLPDEVEIINHINHDEEYIDANEIDWDDLDKYE